jgi:hypothetical protein
MMRKYFRINTIWIHEFQGVPWLSDITSFVMYFASHTLCNCEALAYLRFYHLGQYLMELGGYLDIPLSEVLHFVRSGDCWRAEQKILRWSGCMCQCGPPLIHPSIHSFFGPKMRSYEAFAEQLLVPENYTKILCGHITIIIFFFHLERNIVRRVMLTNKRWFCKH